LRRPFGLAIGIGGVNIAPKNAKEPKKCLSVMAPKNTPDLISATANSSNAEAPRLFPSFNVGTGSHIEKLRKGFTAISVELIGMDMRFIFVSNCK
jgi:hypothetical protein